MGRYERGKWSVVAVNASNGSEEEADGALSLFLEKDSRTQFTRRFWLPPHSSRKTWLPIRTPNDFPVEQKILHASVLRVVETDDGLVLSHAKGEQLISESILPLDPIELHTGAIFGQALPGHPYTTSQPDDEAYETIVAARMLYNGERKILSLDGQFSPPYPEAYDALDQLVVCSDRFATDSGGLAAMRSWIARGGRAWIMLDLVDMDAIRALLGNATPCDIVDRVELTEFTIETPNSATVRAEPSEEWSAEVPVEFVRVMTDSVRVYSSIDGWPAAFSIPFGNGDVVITTLAARGWRYQFDEFDESIDPTRPTSGPTQALRNLASEFNQQSGAQTPLSDALIKEVLSEQLGYRVPSRNVAALILGLNCIVILVVGVWMARREQLERIMWVVPTATLSSALVLVTIGSANTSSVPATSSILRLANVSSETNEVHSEAIAAFYSPDTVELSLEVDPSGVVLPELQDLTGVAKRAIWDDTGHGRWEQVDVASGSVRFATARENRNLQHPLRARATFGPSGLEGGIVGVGQIGTPTDAIAAAPPAPHSTVTIDATGAFRIGANDILSQTEFLSGAILTDEQQRRQTIYRHILAPREGIVYPQRPTLFVWGDSHSFGLTTPDSFRQSGSTLFAIPFDIGRTLPKQRFFVPSSFIRMSNAAAGHGASASYNPRTGRWMKDVTSPTTSFFRFVLPRAVTPCNVESVAIILKIHAPSRTVELTGLRNHQQVTIETLESPSGTYTFPINDSQLLELNEEGALHFGINVSKTEAQTAAAEIRDAPQDPETSTDDFPLFDSSTWQIDYLRLEVSGETM